MFQIGLRFIERRNRESSCRRTVSQTFDLGKDEPHPVTALLSRLKFRPHVLVNRILSADKPLKIIGAAAGHAVAERFFSSPAWMACPSSHSTDGIGVTTIRIW